MQERGLNVLNIINIHYFWTKRMKFPFNKAYTPFPKTYFIATHQINKSSGFVVLDVGSSTPQRKPSFMIIILLHSDVKDALL